MRNVRFGVVKMTAAALLMMAAQPAAGQDKAAEVMSAARAAIGGRALDSMKTFSLQGRMARNMGARQMTSNFELLVQAPDKYVRIEEMTAPVARTMTNGFNGDTPIRPANMSMGAGGMRVIVMGPGNPLPDEKLTPEQEAEMNQTMLRVQRQEITRLMLGWFAMPHPSLPVTFAYAGEAESPDGKAHVIDVTADGFSARLFIDQATSLPLMLTFEGPKPRTMTVRGPAPGGAAGHGSGQTAGSDAVRSQVESLRNEPPVMVENRLYFGDWREAEGVMFPHVLQRAVEGETVEEWTFEKVHVNPKIDSKKFQS